MSFQNREKTIKLRMLIMAPTVVVHMSTDSFSVEVNEPNPRCAARNARQAKVINRAKTARLVLNTQHDVTLIRRRVPCNSSSTTDVQLRARSQ